MKSLETQYYLLYKIIMLNRKSVIRHWKRDEFGLRDHLRPTQLLYNLATIEVMEHFNLLRKTSQKTKYFVIKHGIKCQDYFLYNNLAIIHFLSFDRGLLLKRLFESVTLGNGKIPYRKIIKLTVECGRCQ